MCNRYWMTYSGAKYPVVPNTLVEIWPFILSEPIFANPKSDTLALKFWSKRMLLHLKSRWITDGVVCSCRNSRALAQSSAILNRVPQFNGWPRLWGVWRWCCRVPLGMNSNIRRRWCWSAQYPRSSIRYGECRRLSKSTCQEDWKKTKENHK